MRNIALLLLLLLQCNHAEALMWVLLGRATVTRGLVGVAEGTGVRAVGVASRAVGTARDFSWLEREVASAAIQHVVSGALKTGSTVNVPKTDCLVIEFDNYFNFVANYCQGTIEIEQFAQHDTSSGNVIIVNCQPACVVQPGQVMRFPPLSAPGPIVSAKFRQLQNQLTYSTPVSADSAPPQQAPQLPSGVACGDAAYNMRCPSLPISGTDCRRCQ